MIFFVMAAIALMLPVIGLVSDQRLHVLPFVSNLQGVNAVKGLMASPRAEALGQAGEGMLEQCLSYPVAAAILQDSRITPLQKQTLLDAQSRCWISARPALVAGWRAETLWGLGRDEETCKLLIELKAANKALAYARQAVEASDWPRGTLYLRCVGDIARLGVWVSPWWVAELYQQVGQHYDTAGEVEYAIAAYGAASDWLPDVWAMPYVRKAQLLWDQKRTNEAIDWIIAGIPRCADATCAFYLWLELGEMMVAQGAAENGLCAYQKARDVMDQVPDQNLPAALRQQTQEKLNMLADQVGAAPPRCFEDYPGLLTH